jgi:2-oxoisovalerate dehydrogenase E1 component
VTQAAARARAGEGPTLLEFKTFRMRGHEEASGTAYIPKRLFEEWGRKDPVANFEKLLIERGVLTRADADAARKVMKERIDEIADEALAAPDPSSTAEREIADVWAPSLLTLGEPGAASPSDALAAPSRAGESGTRATSNEGSSGAASSRWPERRYVDAVTEGLRAAMVRNPRTILLGQDIAEYGGVFKVTEGFLEEFGRARVRNTPIIESGAVGAALGLALDGFVPMVEMQFGDFITCGFNQIVNNLAKTHYRWGARVPVVVRCPVGGGVGAGPFHSQNPEAWFTHVAGLKVVAPATPYDAKGLLIAAFEDGNPVLYLEHKFLYRSAKGPVPGEDYAVPIGRARIARAGSDATIVTWGVGLHWALAAADALAGERGSEIEVIDLRSLLPWDRAAVLESVKKTGRALVLHEAPLAGGFGAEVAAAIAADAFAWLDAPVAREGGLDIPIPFSRDLEEIFSPKGRLAAALGALLAY